MNWVDVEQNTNEWLSLRIGKITASKFGSIINTGSFGKVANDYALSVALERIKGIPSVNQIKTYHMKRGHEQESIAKSLYEATYFCEVTNGGFFYDDNFGDSPDGLVGSNGGIEIKSVIDSVQRANIKRGKYDPSYHGQIIGHLESSEREWFDFVSYCADYPEGKQLFVDRLYRDEFKKEIEHLKERKIEFNKLVESIVKEINEYN